ncbi:hypothetical protein D9M72_407360 [compost metagenome]
MIDQRPVGLVTDGGNQRDLGGRHSPDHRLVVEAPEVLKAATAAGNDQHVWPGDRPTGRDVVEAADRRRHLVARAVALDAHRPDDDMHGETVGNAVQDIANDSARRRSDHADHLGHIGQ